MTFNQLKYVVAVAKTGSINKAAAELFISQSVVSAAIAGLEKEIGHDIFVRSNRGVALTPFGHTFVSYVSSIQTQLQQLDGLIRRDFVQHEFSLSVASSGYYFLNRICAELFERYREIGIRIEQFEDHENNVADLVDSQMAEIGIVRVWSCYKNAYLRQLRAHKIQHFDVASLSIAVTVGVQNPLYHQKNDYVNAADLRQLAESGLLLKINTTDGADHFDHRCDAHYHAGCLRCGRVFDVELRQPPQLEKLLGDTHGFAVSGYDLLFRGVCPECGGKTSI